MNEANRRLRQELDRASEIKARLIEDARCWVQAANRELENAEACLARWERATPYEVLEHEARENKRNAERSEAEQDRKVAERDKQSETERALFVRGATRVSMAVFLVALLASAIAPFVLSEYAARHLVAGAWASFAVTLLFCWG